MISTTKQNPWHESSEAVCNQADHELILGEEMQTIDGFGGCFNELGMLAAETLSEKDQKIVFDELFSEKGCALHIGRLSIGANDFSESWYSYDEEEGDYELKHFSIDRDRKHVIPYVREAQKRCPDMTFFASPWSPPTWMKYPKVYNYGRIVDTDENLKAYARYFRKYIEEYQKEKIPVSMIHVQNEIIADQKFPSCVWSAQMLEKFICDYLYPEIGDIAEVWFGTVNAPETITTRYHDLLNRCMQNPKFKNAIRGTGLQWAGKFAVQQVHDDYPDLKIYQTESECGDGQNSWEYAKYIFEMIRHYFRNGALAYVYWNMILGDSESTWGWKQNSMITVTNGSIVYNPEFYLMKHFAHFVKKGAALIKTSGSWSSNSVVFRNPDGKYVVVMMNPFDMERTIKIGERYVALEANSFSTIVL